LDSPPFIQTARRSLLAACEPSVLCSGPILRHQPHSHFERGTSSLGSAAPLQLTSPRPAKTPVMSRRDRIVCGAHASVRTHRSPRSVPVAELDRPRALR
jgi:hypothetical protein